MCRRSDNSFVNPAVGWGWQPVHRDRRGRGGRDNTGDDGTNKEEGVENTKRMTNREGSLKGDS